MRSRWRWGGILGAVAVGLLGCARTPEAPADSSHARDGRFHNAVPRQSRSFGKSLAIAWRMLTREAQPPDRPIPVMSLSAAALAAAPDDSLYRLGHSTVLFKLRSGFWLTDPVFSERASPVSWAGPKRFHPPPIRIPDLPPLQGVIISHDHYDHLDKASVLALAPKVGVFIVPLGVGQRLIGWGVAPDKVRELDWWQSTRVAEVEVTATPARHFSGRGLGDSDRSLWASWSIQADGLRMFFSGDTGYHEDFKRIGERLGPFDIALIENGAYNNQWPDVHMQPEQTLQAFKDVRGRWLVPIHNGTFDLSTHAWREPFDRISALAAAESLKLATPRMGERLDMLQPQAGSRWWSGGGR